MTPWTVAHQAPLSTVILQARVLEWVDMFSSRGSSQPRDETPVSYIAGRFFIIWATGKHSAGYCQMTLDEIDDTSSLISLIITAGHSQWVLSRSVVSNSGSSVHRSFQARILEQVAHISSLGDLPNPGIELTSLASPALADRLFTTSTTWEASGWQTNQTWTKTLLGANVILAPDSWIWP